METQLIAQDWLSNFSSSLAACEEVLCGLRGTSNISEFIQSVHQQAGGAAGPCTAVWIAGSIAYRCRTCQKTASSAICVNCFKAGNHEHHDYAMYVSDAGGCCDCGDVSSWKPEGCCPQHAPQQARPDTTLFSKNECDLFAALAGTVLCVLCRKLHEIRTAAALEPPDAGASAQATALQALSWLQCVCQLAQLRELLCAEALRPLTPPSAAQHAAATLCISQHTEVGVLCSTLRAQQSILVKDMEPITSAAGGGGGGLGTATQHIVAAMKGLPGTVMQELATALLLMLYNMQYKFHFTLCLMEWYGDMVMLSGEEDEGPAVLSSSTSGQTNPLGNALDRITVQLFNIQDVVIQLCEHGDLLHKLLDALLGCLRSACSDGNYVDPDHPLIAGRSYIRVMADIKMIVVHPPVAALLLEGGGPHSPLAKLLDALGMMQRMCPLTRQLGNHVEYESYAWNHAVQLEAAASHFLMKETINTLCWEPCDALTLAQRIQILKNAALCVVSFTKGVYRSQGSRHAEVGSVWSKLMEGEQVSVHLPLQRFLCGLLVSLMQLAEHKHTPHELQAVAFQAVEYTCARIAQPVDGHGGVEGEGLWPYLVGDLLAALVCLTQVRARLWLRNGDTLRQLPSVYYGSYWRNHSMVLDLTLLQLWLAKQQDVTKCVRSLLEAFGADQGVVGVSAMGDGVRVSGVAEGLRILVQCCKENMIVCKDARAGCRRALIHWLAVEDRSYSQLQNQLTPETAPNLLDEVLAEIADFHSPNVQHRGVFSLKPHMWVEFDPFFPHYTPQNLQDAMERAMNSNWRPHYQLTPMPDFAPPLQGLQRIPASSVVARLSWAVLQYASSHHKPAADEVAIAVLNLLAMAQHQLSAQLPRPMEVDHAEGSVAGSRGSHDPTPSVYAPDLSVLMHFISPLDSPFKPSIIAMLQACGSPSWPANHELRDVSAVMATRLHALITAAAPHEEAVPAAASTAVVDDQDEDDTAEQQRRAKALERRAKIMQSMKAQQAAFKSQSLSSHAADLSESDDDEDLDNASGQPGPASGNEAGSHAAGTAFVRPIHHPSHWSSLPGECALCRQGPEAGPLGLVALARPSCATSFACREAPKWQECPPSSRIDAPTSTSYSTAHPGDVSVLDVAISCQLMCCGHALHKGCHASYMATQSARRVGNPRDRLASAAVGEFLCPTCRRLNNCLMPLVVVDEEEQTATSGASTNAAPSSVCQSQQGMTVHDMVKGLKMACEDVHWMDMPHLPTGQGAGAAAAAAAEDVYYARLGWQGVVVEHLSRHCRDVLRRHALLQIEAVRQHGQQQVVPLLTGPLGRVPHLHEQLLVVVQQALGVPLDPLDEDADGIGVENMQGVLDAVQTQSTAQRNHPGDAADGPATTSSSDVTDASALPATSRLQQLLHHNAEQYWRTAEDRLVRCPSHAALWGPLSYNIALWDVTHRADGNDVSGLPSSWVDVAHWRALRNLTLSCLALGGGSDTSGQRLTVAQRAVEWVGWMTGVRDVNVQAFTPLLSISSAFLPPVASDVSRSPRCLDQLWDVPQAVQVGGVARGEGSGRHGEGLYRSQGYLSGYRDMAEGDLFVMLMELFGALVGPKESAVQHHLGYIAQPALVLKELIRVIYVVAVWKAGLQAFVLWSQHAKQAGAQVRNGDIGDAPDAGVHQPRDESMSVEDFIRGAAEGMQETQETSADSEQPSSATARKVDGQVCTTSGTQHSTSVHEAAEGRGTKHEVQGGGVAGDVEEYISSTVVQLVRRCLILHNLVCGQPPPCLTTPLTPSLQPGPAPSATCTTQRTPRQQLAAAVQLPSVASALKMLLHHPNKSDVISRCAPGPVHLPPTAGLPREGSRVPYGLPCPTLRPVSLLHLPELFQELYLRLKDSPCSRCAGVPVEPALCLTCGEVLCWRECSNGLVGGALYLHGLTCGAGAALYLMLKHTQVMITCDRRASFLPSPYLDSHGEEDVALKRGRPLYLNTLRMMSTRRLWVSSSFDYDTPVLHKSHASRQF